jgi:carbon storage regulator
MLVLSRRNGEALRIGSRIRIQVVAIQGGQVRLAIDAPLEIGVHREEIYQRIAEANRASACDAPGPRPAQAEEDAARDAKEGP